MTSHLVIPDTQVKPGVPLDYLRWIGRYILDRKPDVVVHLGDHWDMPSLSQWDRGKIQMEGRRYKADVQAGNTGLRLLDEPTVDANRKRRNPYLPRKVLLRGNHEYRILRAVESSPEWEGFVGYHDLDTRDWEVYDFQVPVEIDGVSYSHYFANPMTGKPQGGQALTLLKTLGHSYVQGHRQVYEYANRFVKGRKQIGITAGASYPFDEDYKGPQGNAHWRGVLMLHEVEDGSADVMEVSLDYLCRKYEGVPLSEFLRARYPDQDGFCWR